MDELAELGRQLTQAFRVARESPEAKEAEAQFIQAIRTLEAELKAAFGALQERTQSSTFKEEVVRTASTTAEEASANWPLAAQCQSQDR